MPRRLGLIGGLVDSIEPPLAKADRERLIRLLAVLLNSSALRMWRDHLGASVDQAADDMDWIVRAVVAASRRKNDEPATLRLLRDLRWPIDRGRRQGCQPGRAPREGVGSRTAWC